MKMFIAVLIALSAQAFANHPMMKDMEKRPFDQNKKMMQDSLSKKSSMIDDEKKCVSNATDNTLKACHTKMMEEKQAMEEEIEKKSEDMKKKM